MAQLRPESGSGRGPLRYQCFHRHQSALDDPPFLWKPATTAQLSTASEPVVKSPLVLMDAIGPLTRLQFTSEPDNWVIELSSNKAIAVS